jgi:hypothetical protein
MTIALYMDVHIPQSITIQLRRRGIDVLTAQEDGTIESKVMSNLCTSCLSKENSKNQSERH